MVQPEFTRNICEGGAFTEWICWRHVRRLWRTKSPPGHSACTPGSEGLQHGERCCAVDCWRRSAAWHDATNESVSSGHRWATCLCARPKQPLYPHLLSRGNLSGGLTGREWWMLGLPTRCLFLWRRDLSHCAAPDRWRIPLKPPGTSWHVLMPT